ncbi:hypothetical protein BCR36DRAFT_364783 [Piromyces finnis]|uniref:RING-CH-type domain-containing protein n=1 Tax=Piromyces finnis TaxID=1754191 RepID=A0A1Y1UQL2_9FUNG|nr:hypothetical protein BCR36DRAFT_364783 [Piromyces finnis]|eukprot:ORX40368.1 hypothetical protein BCR36DRAFT_364783 [Piromyces finnis]
MKDEKVCRICLSNTLNLFDDDLIKKIFKQSEKVKKENQNNQQDHSFNNYENENGNSEIEENEKKDHKCCKDNENEYSHCNDFDNIENENRKDSSKNGCNNEKKEKEQERETENIWNRIKTVDKNIIKKCIYDYFYENNRNDLFSFIENTYNSIIRLFIYLLFIPKWIYWMSQNLFFFDIWKNPFLYYNKSCFKHNSDDIDETYLSEMTYLKRKPFLNDKKQQPYLNKEGKEGEGIPSKKRIYNDAAFKLNTETASNVNDPLKNQNNGINKDNKIVFEHDNKENDKTSIKHNQHNDNNNDDDDYSYDINSNNNNNDDIRKNIEINSSFNRLYYLKKSVMRTSSSLSSLNIVERTIKKANSLEIPLRKSNSGSFFHPFNDTNKSSLGVEKEKNILRSSYMSLDEFFKNSDSHENVPTDNTDSSYQKNIHSQKQKIKHSLYNTISSFEKRIINQPISNKIYCTCIYPLKVRFDDTRKLFHYKKNKLSFSINVQKNIQKSWWKNQNKIKNYQKKYFFLNRIPEDVNYYIDKLISPCNCKGSQKYVHSYCLDEWRMKTSLEVGQQENCILCRQSYRKKDNNKWYTKLQNKKIQNILLFLMIIALVVFGGFIMKYILDITYKYLDIGIEYEEYSEHANSSLWDINNYDDSILNQDNCQLQLSENQNLYPEENIIYSFEETVDNTSEDLTLHEILFSTGFLRGINVLSSIIYHVLAGMFFWGSIINTIILYDSIEMVIRHHFNRDLKLKPLLLIVIIYFWWIYCSAAFEDFIGINEYAVAQKFETIISFKDGWVPELIEYSIFIAKWTLRIVTMELGIYFNGICILKELITYNYSACLIKDQILNFEEK